MKQQQPEQLDLRKIRRLAAICILVVLLLATWWIINPHIMTEEYATFTRSDGNYRVVVSRMPIWPAILPGQGSDAPGVVRLYNRQGVLLHETKVEMVQLVNHVEWVEKMVSIKLVADWELPD